MGLRPDDETVPSVTGALIIMSTPLRVVEAGVAQPGWLMLAFAFMLEPGGGLAGARPQDRGGPKPSNLTVAGWWTGSIGAFIDVFVAAGAGGLAEPNSLQFGQDGDLYVGSWVNHNVSRFDGQTGAFIEVVADVGASQFQTDFAFGPDGLLYVGHTTSLYEEIMVFDPATGTEVNSIEVIA